MREQVLDPQKFPQEYLDFIMGVKDTLANIPHRDYNCSFVKETKCVLNGQKDNCCTYLR